METHQVDVVAFAVLGYLEQIENAEEAGLASDLRGDIGKPNRINRVDLNLALPHAIAGSHSYMGSHPDADTASDPPAANSLAKPLGKQHE